MIQKFTKKYKTTIKKESKDIYQLIINLDDGRKEKALVLEIDLKKSEPASQLDIDFLSDGDISPVISPQKITTTMAAEIVGEALINLKKPDVDPTQAELQKYRATHTKLVEMLEYFTEKFEAINAVAENENLAKNIEDAKNLLKMAE